MDCWAPGGLHFAQARCADCGLLVAQPQASDAEMESYYGRAFFEEQWPDPERLSALNAEAYQRHEWPLMQQLWKEWPPSPGARVVEVGCGYGVLLRLLRDAGYRASGCEMSGKAVDFCRTQGLEVIPGRAPGLPFSHESFDVAIAMHVIEHVPDPRGFVKEMRELVRPGGLVVLVTEDAWISQYAWDRLRSRLRGRIPPFRSSTDHTFVFQAGHLKTLLREAGCDAMRTRAFSRVPSAESLHWKLYKGTFRILDRMLAHGEFLMAVGRRSDDMSLATTGPVDS
jgi:SAM-dependent methyltransferase